MITRKGKGFSVIEVIVASALSLSLGIIVATTINTATNSMRKSNYRILANENARDLSTKVNKFIASAEQRSYCLTDTNVYGSGACQNIAKDTRLPAITYYGPMPAGKVGYQMEFYSPICVTITKCQPAAARRINPSKIIIYVEKTPSNGLSKLGICIEQDNAILDESLLTTPIPSNSASNCTSHYYRLEGIKDDNNNMFQLLSRTGPMTICSNTAPIPLTASFSRSQCLDKTIAIRFVTNLPWLRTQNSTGYMGSNNTKIDTITTIRGSANA